MDEISVKEVRTDCGAQMKNPSNPHPSSSSPAAPHLQIIHHSEFRDAAFDRLFTLLEEIKKTQRVHGMMIQSLLNQRQSSITAAELPTDISFPLKTLADVEDLELKLMDPGLHRELAA